MRTDGKGFHWGSLTSVWEMKSTCSFTWMNCWKMFQRLVPTFAKCPIGKTMVMSKTATETKGKKRRVKVQFTFFCPKMSDDSCYLQNSLPLHSRGIFLTGKSLDTSREFRVFSLSAEAEVFCTHVSALLESQVCVCVCVCAQDLCNSSVSLGPPSSVCQLANITFLALSVPFSAHYANNPMTNAFWRWGGGGATGGEDPDFISIPRGVCTCTNTQLGLIPAILQHT